MSDLDLPDTDGLVVAYDIEASGLHPDPGPKGNARISITSVAWFTDQGMESRVYAWDQGRLDKTDVQASKTADSLFDLIDGMAAPNRGEDEWHQFFGWLQRQWIVNHNLPYDMQVTAAGHRKWGGGYDLRDRFLADTLVWAALLWPNQPVALKAVAERLHLAGGGERDLERALGRWLAKNGKRYDLAPWDLIGPYAAKDAELALLLHQHEVEYFESGVIPWEVAQRETETARVLLNMQMRGIGFDVEGVRAEAAKLRTAKIEALAAIPFKPATEEGARRYWFGETRDGGLGLPPSELTDKGKPSVNQSVVRRLKDQGVAGAEEYDRLNKIDTALSMWYENWPALAGADGRLRCVYRQTKSADDTSGGGEGQQRGTVSGRFAVERVQLQAIPHDYQIPENVEPIRRFFQASVGKELWEVDLSQVEFRVAAAVSKCQGWLEGFAAGEDAHATTCRLIFGLEPDHPDWEQYRNIGKRIGLGTLYGAGIRRIRDEIERWSGLSYSEDQVADWRNTFRDRVPEIFKVARQAQNKVERCGHIRLAGGRLRHFKTGEPVHKAFNQLIQGSVAELMKVAMVEIDQQEPGMLVGQIHDSTLLEVREVGSVKNVQEILRSTFSGYYGGVVDFPTAAKQW